MKIFKVIICEDGEDDDLALVKNSDDSRYSSPCAAKISPYIEERQQGKNQKNHSHEGKPPKHWCGHCWDAAQVAIEYVIAVEDDRGIQYPTNTPIPYNYCPSCGRDLRG